MIKRKTYAWLFLALFSTLIAHSLIPHIHDAVVLTKHHHSTNGHTHGHDHHHNHSAESKNKTKGTLDINFGDHSHADYNADYISELTRSENKQIAHKNIDGYKEQRLLFFQIANTHHLEAPPNIQDTGPRPPFIPNCALRAPPSLA